MKQTERQWVSLCLTNTRITSMYLDFLRYWKQPGVYDSVTVKILYKNNVSAFLMLRLQRIRRLLHDAPREQHRCTGSSKQWKNGWMDGWSSLSHHQDWLNVSPSIFMTVGNCWPTHSQTDAQWDNLKGAESLYTHLSVWFSTYIWS